MKPKRQKYVQVVRGKFLVNFRWPDGVRNRKIMPTEEKANEISLRFQAACVDNTWMDLRKKLDLDEKPETDMRFKEFAELYLQEYVESYNKDKKSKESRLRILGRKLDQVFISALTPQHITQFVNYRKKQKTNNKTINRDLIVLGHLLRWGVQQHYLETNPLPEIQMLREIQWEGQRPTDEVIDAVFAKLDPRVLPIFTFLRETGCRRNEVLSLKHPQLDLENRQVVICAVTKNGKSRRVPLTEKAIRAVHAMPRTLKTKYVFYHPDSLDKWYNCRKPWEEARKEAGYEWLRIHDLRHAFGIKLAEAGCPMHFISEVMGHATIDFTRKQYAKFSPDSAANAVLGYLEGSKSLQNGQMATFWPLRVENA